MPLNPDDPVEYKGSTPEHNWSEVKSAHRAAGGPGGSVNRHRNLKVWGTRAMYATKAAVGGTSAGMGTGVFAVVGSLAAGTAVSATGVGLAAATAAMAVGTAGLAARSLDKTIGHSGELAKIGANLSGYRDCQPLQGANDADVYHRFIATMVLPYIIRQKKLKAVKKGVNMVPGVILVTGIYSGWRNVQRKYITGTQGVKRSFYANVLGEHLITCECPLATAIVRALMGDDVEQLKLMDLSEVAPIIAPKMKSI